MSDGQQGFDDLFDDKLFGTRLHNSVQARPQKWPRSVSEMRGLTSFPDQGMHQDHDVEHGRYQMPRAAPEPSCDIYQPVSCCAPRRSTVMVPRGSLRSMTTPYYRHDYFFKQPVSDFASSRGGGVWHGYLGQKYYDRNRGWVWIDSDSRA